MKNFILLLLLPFVIIAVCQPVKKLVINACESVICLQDTGGINTNITSIGEHRHRRTLKPIPPTCSINQYFDEDEGRCLGVVGGGKVLYINNKISCGTNTLKPHCTNPRYYYICKKNKTILVQCTHGKHFENRLKKCVHVPDDIYVSVTVDPKMETVSFFQLPDCNKPGSFPVPGDCAQFYTCETNGHRMHQNFFRCPKNMAYDIDTEMCTPSNNCEGSEDLPSMCAWSTSKEKLTLEEAEKWLNIWPLNDTRLINSDVKISKNFTLNENGSVTICETIFAIEEKNATTTNIYETSATTQSTNDVVTTVVSYMKPPTSAFVEVSDHSDVATSTKRDKETSRSSNTDDSASTKAYSARTDEPTVMKDIKLPSEVGDDELSLETTTFGEPVLKEKMTELPTVEMSTNEISTDKSIKVGDDAILANQSIPSTTEKEIEAITKANINDTLPDITTLGKSILQEQYSTTEKDIESSSSEIRNIPDDPTIVAKEGMSSTTKMDAQTAETSTDWPFLETTTLGEPSLEGQYSTSGPQKSPDPSSFILADPTVSTNQEIPDTTEKEIEGITKANINDTLPDITTLAESILQEQYSTTEKDIESPSSEIRNIPDDPTIVAKEGMSSTTKRDTQTTETSTDWPFLETTTLGEPLLEGQYSTSGPQKSPDPSSFILADPTVSTNQEIPDTTEKEIEGITKANINDPLPDITTLAESILQEQYSTTEKDIESSSSKIRNIPDDPTIVAKEGMSSTTKMDVQTTETSTDWPFLETTTLGEPPLEGQYSTSAAQKSPDPSSFILADPTVSTSKEIPDTTEKEIEGITKADINDPLPDITTLAESILQEQYSSTEKDIESSSSEIRNIHDDPTIFANQSIFSSTDTNAQNTTTVSTESVSSSTDAAHYVDIMSTTSSPKNVHEFNSTSVNIGQMENLIPMLNNVPLTKAIFVVNDISSSTISPNLKTTNETVIDNAVSTLNVVSTTESTTHSTLSDSKTIKSISSESEPLPIMKPITSPGELIANCKTLYAANNSLTSIQSDARSTGKSSNSTDNETYSKSFDRQHHSHVTDKNKTKKDVAGKGTEIAPEMKYSGRTISKHIVLPIASAVLNITDKIERRWRYRIRNLLLKHTSKHLTRM
ncbi:PREDICTED: mucin-3A-like [Habropoda laboriosa]|uniref:mucin-3A-like n=1 Tax=Habropoda laboriosa TaxID=597456 RepID=UPI00083CC249|nr:PREDICTED: mucin-3A-like [Habropoda laboriosa]